LAAGVEPAVYAVCTSGSVFHVIRTPGIDRPAPQTDYTLAIVRMD
jgi:hypothetical protein